MPASTAYPEIMIKNDTLFTCDKYGNTGIQIAREVSNAYWSDDQSLFLITKINGEVLTTDRYGNTIRTICKEAKDARFDSGTNISVRMFDGKNRVLDKYGNLVRQL